PEPPRRWPGGESRRSGPGYTPGPPVPRSGGSPASAGSTPAGVRAVHPGDRVVDRASSLSTPPGRAPGCSPAPSPRPLPCWPASGPSRAPSALPGEAESKARVAAPGGKYAACQGVAKGGPASPGARRFRGGRGRWVAWKPDRRRGRPAGRGELDPGGPSRQGSGDQAREDRFHDEVEAVVAWVLMDPGEPGPGHGDELLPIHPDHLGREAGPDRSLPQVLQHLQLHPGRLVRQVVGGPG